MKAEEDLSARVPRGRESRSQRMFYLVFLPLGAIVNLVLGLVVLGQMRLGGEFGWLDLGTGAFCCMIAGWLAASAWNKSYWSRKIARQVAVWRKIADAIFDWLEEAPLPAEALHRLKSSLDEVVPSAK